MTTHSSIGMLGGGGKFSVDFSKFYRYLYRLAKMWAKSNKNKKKTELKSENLLTFSFLFSVVLSARAFRSETIVISFQRK